jgi:hypothetical protein
MTARRRPGSQKKPLRAPNTKDRGGDRTTDSAPMQSPRVINAAPSLEKAELYGIDDTRPFFSRAMALAGRVFIETIPQWLAVGAMLSLIFGGCCSNVFALESIVKVEPASGAFSGPRRRRRREVCHWAQCVQCARDTRREDDKADI